MGAVSKTMQENSIDWTCLQKVYRLADDAVRQSAAQTHFMISAKPIASSTPGMAKARSCIIPPIPPPCESAVNRNGSD